MPINITIINGKQFKQQPGKTILDSGLEQGIILEYSCNNGKCGACKTTVLSGSTHPLYPELSLTEAELEAGQILTCCREAETDIQLDIEDLGILAQQNPRLIPGRIDAIQLLSPDIIAVELRLPLNEILDYLPGQYIDVTAPSNITRSYSLANAPRSDNKLELHIRKVPNGAMSQYWFKKAKVGDLLRFNGPLGTFFLREIANKDLVFLATGTGIAPVKSMLESLAHVSKINSPKSVTVLWGGRSAQDFYINLADISVNHNYILVQSRPDERWTGVKGYVQDALINIDPDLSNMIVYACGSNAMIHSAKNKLVAAGLLPKHFYSDAFVCSGNTR